MNEATLWLSQVQVAQTVISLYVAQTLSILYIAYINYVVRIPFVFQTRPI